MNKGFFDLDKTISRGDEKIIPSIKKVKQISCKECGLSNNCNSPKMKPTGKNKLNILIVAEAPGQKEDEEGRQLIGQSGKLLRSILKEIDLDLDRDFLKTNAIICYPGKDKNNKYLTPSPIQIAACRKNLLNTIEEYKPKVIIPLGKIAIDSLIGNKLSGRMSNLSMTDWNGVCTPDQDYKCYICPTWHPSFLLRQGKDEADSILVNQVKKQFLNAVKLSKQPFYISNYSSDCFIIREVKEAIKIIKEMMKKEIVAFDYETTGRKPYREGHSIATVSISDGLYSYSFPYFNDKTFRNIWQRFLDSNTKKICHNGKFENLWGMNRAGYNNTEGIEINNFYWDTMLAAHCINNNKKTNLKFHTYINFGIIGYDDEIDPYLQCTKQELDLYGANGINRIEKAPIDKLLLYNAMDSLFTYKLFENQKAIADDHLIKGIKFFTKTSISLSKIENTGIVFYEDLANEEENKLKIKLNKIERNILQMPELDKWDKDTKFRVSAPADITHLLFDILKYKCKATTKTGKPSSNIESLQKYDIPIVNKCLKWRKWYKVLNTYLVNFTRENNNGIIKSFYNLNLVESFRSSSDSPNYQNIPKHDKEVSTLLRKLLGPRPGNYLGEYDYASMEVRVIACCNKDPELIKYINNPSSDMHRDIASQIYLMKKEEITKELRYTAKNSFVFPTFYGSWFENTAVNLYNVDEETKDYLKEKGIENIDDFTSHIKNVEKSFWNKFNIAFDFKEKTIADYRKNGYVNTLNGFRFQGPMTNNQVLNYQVQGPAFHCLLWTLDRLIEQIEKRGMETIIDGQIHDALYPDYPKEEEKELDYMIWNYGTRKIREYWDWIIVPLQIEKSRTKTNWAEMETIGILKGE